MKINFFNNQFLSDCTIIDHKKIEYKCHKVVLANKSEIFK